jgi:hypothetical protein
MKIEVICKTLDINGRIILKCILKRAWTALIWLSIGISGGLSCVGFHKMLEKFLVPGKL